MSLKINLGKYCVYTHSIDGVVFYVGKGSSHRPIQFYGRSSWWRDVVDAAGGVFDVEIIAWFDSEKEALRFEKKKIKTLKPKANRLDNIPYTRGPYRKGSSSSSGLSDREFWTPEEVAKICKVTVRTVYRWIHNGALCAMRVGPFLRVRPEDLEEFLKAGKV
jgi:excisionase family DNA binding protein